jgi:hypothetical protein
MKGADNARTVSGKDPCIWKNLLYAVGFSKILRVSIVSC